MRYPALSVTVTAASLLATPRNGHTVCDPQTIRSSHTASDEAWQACDCAGAKSARAIAILEEPPPDCYQRDWPSAEHPG